MVGLEKTLYYVREDNPEGVVEVCVIVYKTNNKDCPISFPFDVRISTVEDSEGIGLQLYFLQCVHKIRLLYSQIIIHSQLSWQLEHVRQDIVWR